MLTLTEMKRIAGMVVPTWYPDSMPIHEMERILAPTVADVRPFAEPENVLVVVDGSPKARQAAENVRRSMGGFEILFQPDNQGKGGAVANGLERLLADARVQFLVTRDHDNDHLSHDALNLVNLTDRMQRDTGSDRVMGIGRRGSIHRHLGFVRGEYEELMNEVAWEAARFALARQGRTVNTQYFSAYGLVPDMQTGFKCYGRGSARLMVEALRLAPQLTPGLDVRRHGAELPAIVETLLHEGVVGEVMRLAWENQPLSTYDLAGRVQVKGTVLAWTFCRTGVPLAVARQLLMNSVARRLMSKEEKGLADLLSLANWALQKLAGLRGEIFVPIQGLSLAEYF